MSNLVNTLVQQFKSKSQHQRFVQQSQKKFDINTYRFQQMTQAMARKGYNQLRQKYQRQQLQVKPRGWHENQRKIFVWFLCALIKYLKEPNRIEEEHWQELSETFFQKDILFLKYQFNAIQKNRKRHQWTLQQDNILTSCTEHIQKAQWNQIAKQIFFQTHGNHFKAPKQCRQRWQNHLNTKVRKEEWLPEQDLIILKYVQENGKKWSKIVQQLKQTRTQHMVKNRFKSLISKSEIQLKEKNLNIQNENELIKYIINSILSENPLVDRKSSLQNGSEFKDKMEDQIPEPRILKAKKSHKDTLHGFFQRGTDGNFNQIKSVQYSPVPSIFESKSPGNLATSFVLSNHTWTPRNLTPTPTATENSFLNSFSDKGRIFSKFLQKKGLNVSQAQSTTQKFFKCNRSDSNQMLSFEIRNLADGSKYQSRVSTPMIETLETFLMNRQDIDKDFLNPNQQNSYNLYNSDLLSMSRQFNLQKQKQKPNSQKTIDKK